jgi:hypothetical protein
MVHLKADHLQCNMDFVQVDIQNLYSYTLPDMKDKQYIHHEGNH